jgi:ubiquinone/menaquinone biosynthesis C-methylase UbiE
MASVAKQNTDLPVIVGDAQALPWKDASFDAMVANHMLYHVPDLEAALDEFVRVLRPGGRFFAATNGRAHFNEVHDILGNHARYIGTFGLENGPSRISSHFVDVAVERYDDAIVVREAEPVIAYVKSMSRLDPAGEVRLQRQIADAIERDGVFRITKDAGLITARRP